MNKHNFYAIIIGSEILNGRRADKHFEYVKNALLLRGHTLYATFIIKDDEELIKNTFQMIKNDPKSVMFSFGGIGSTPDDLTRQIASNVFSDGKLEAHPKFTDDIIERFQDEAYPHRIHMAYLPKKSKLLKNIVNNMSGFYLDDRYFFMPGFPEMSHPMVDQALSEYYSSSIATYRESFLASTSENTLIHIMNQLDKELEFSSLPMFIDGKAHVEISIAGVSEELVKSSIVLFMDYLDKNSIKYTKLK